MPDTFNAPKIQEIGKLNANISSIDGFDIFADGSVFLATTLCNGDGDGATQLFDIKLVTLKASQIGQFGRGVIGLVAAPSEFLVPAVARLICSTLIGFESFRLKAV